MKTVIILSTSPSRCWPVHILLRCAGNLCLVILSGKFDGIQFLNKSFGGSEMYSNQIPRLKIVMINNLPAETQLGATVFQALLRRIYSAELVRNECGTSGEPVQKGKPENDRIKKQ